MSFYNQQPLFVPFSNTTALTKLPCPNDHAELYIDDSTKVLTIRRKQNDLTTYTDDSGQEKTTSKTVSLLLRPRTFMEFTTDGGLWLGGFFLAPYVSIGTIVGIPAGTLFSLMVRRLQKKKKGKKRK